MALIRVWCPLVGLKVSGVLRQRYYVGQKRQVHAGKLNMDNQQRQCCVVKSKMLSLLFVKLGHNTDNEYILNIHPSIFSCLTNLLAGWDKIQKGPKWATTPITIL